MTAELRGGGDLVVCDGASRTFGSGESAVVALQGATCRVRRSARIALTGPSGSGKSTLLHLMAGLDRPTAGTISWPGLPASVDHPGTVGVVFQGPSLMPPLNALENIAYPLLLSGMADGEARRAAAQAMEQIGIAELAGSLPDEMSGGQAQRVAVARALAASPALVLADEPTGQLDHEAGAVVMDALVRATDLLDAGLVVATHDPNVAARLDESWQIGDGRLRLLPLEAGAR
ncbi:MAG TPA: ATP-binding cassette domain-containing protein [Nocardioidaceae bacterium]|nr:ATP-binding cassette domain-containing protein [Nocardioidaceae bacterium]